MRLITRLREDQRGSALITAILATALMLALGTALLSIVDTEASQSAGERTRDRAFNLAESVLNSEAFVLGRSWPASTPTPNPVTCSVSGAGFGDTLGSTSPTPTAATARLKANLDASYTDAAYSGATWQVNICDNTTGSNVWSSSLLGNPSWDSNNDNKVWVHAQATVGGLTRVVVGLVQTRTTNPLSSKFGLVSGAMSDDLSATTAAITNASVLSGLKNGLLNTYPPVAADTSPLVPVGTSGVTGVRCGLLSQVGQLKTCVSGALGALSSLPVFDTLVTNGAYGQFPT
ncbi:MAG TPA: hypothetical protein VHZ31_02840, partial [Solirubrobacteraceae bacterium]|nr:hypothetical protein [Solirubrobacteraceae bacterium]